MAETIIKVVKVFIGSPGGLDDERQAAKRIVDEINQSHSEHWGCQIKLVAWEATLPGYGRAQSLINQDLDKCQYFVGALWNHWGSKPDDGDSQYSSGFEEEFDRAKRHVENGTMKDIALFFKDIPEIQLKDIGPSLQQVLAFRAKCEENRKPLFKEFKTAIDFERLFRTTIEQIGWNESLPRPADPEQPSQIEITRASVADGTDGLIAGSSASFIKELLKRPSDWDATSSYEIARFRLAAISTWRQGNDQLYLGNHDANLIFAKRQAFTFSQREANALLDTGIAGFHHQNVPLWHWLTVPSKNADPFKMVRFASALGNSQERANAIRILQSASESIPEADDFFDRRRVLELWLDDERTTQEIAAALDFLSANGAEPELFILEDLWPNIPASHKDSVGATIVSILLRSSLSDAFERLIGLDPDPVSQALASRLFAQPESISTETLTRTLSLKSDEVRRRAATLLDNRQAIDIASAKRLIADSDLEIRLIAIETLERLGEAPQDATIREALIRQRPRGLLAWGLGGGGYEDDTVYKRYQRKALSKLHYEELRQKVESSDVLDDLTISVFYSQYTIKNLSDIRRNLTDGFKGYFDDKTRTWVSMYGEDSKLVTDVRRLEAHLRKGLTTAALDALCAHAAKADLALVRQTLDNHEVAFSEDTLRFLSRYGDWSDRDRILAFYKRYSQTLSFLQIGTHNRASMVASTLYAVRRKRLADLLELEMDMPVKRALIAMMTQKEMRSLSDDIMMKELNANDDQYRKIMALKFAQACSQSRSRRLLEKYIRQDGQRYYNSVHWLDLGASMPQKTVKTVARFELEKLESAN